MTTTSSATPLAALDAVALDTETTGLDARSARLIQVGAVRMQGGRILEDARFDSLVHPGIPIPPATTRVHGITDAQLEGVPAFPAIADALESFLGSFIVIGHTTGFDLAILEREARLAGRPPTLHRSLDVRTLAEVAEPTLDHYDLERIAEALDIRVEGRHTAIGDALTSARIFAALLPRLRARDIRTLAEAEAASRALAERQAAASRVPLGGPPPPPGLQPALLRIDSFAYTHRVGDVMTAPPAWAESSLPIRAVMQQLIEQRISSVLVREADKAIGILTERDVLRAIEQREAAGLDAPATQFVSKPLLTIADDDHVYRAIGRMDRLGIRHLGVTDASGAVVGIVTTRNLLRHRASAAVMMGDAVDCAASEPDLAAAWASLPAVTRFLRTEAVDPRKISAIISAEICAVTRRAAELAEQRMAADGAGPPPTTYALLVLGSAGRGESLLAADQDNALVYAEGAAGGPEDRWFERFATHVAATLDAVGIPFCKGGVMAKTALWRHSLASWHGVVEGWLGRQRPEDILNVDIFFDGVPVHGDASLGAQVLAHAHAGAHRSVTFQKQLTETARNWRPPLTLFGALRTDAGGRIDLKQHGLLPIFTAARALAIRHGEAGLGTPERLRATVAPGAASASDVEALIAAHATIMGEMLDQQLRDGEVGISLSPRVALGQLSAERRAGLKQAVRAVAIATDLVGEGRI